MSGAHRSKNGNDLAAMRARSAALFAKLSDPDSTEAQRAVYRDELVHLHLPLVEHFARRFLNRGEPFDDLLQVGTIGLIKAVDRFDTERGVEFSTYATPTIVGEIKRHFRDRGWAIRVPRRLQELRLSITSATAELTQELGRSPTVSELARKIGVSDEEIIEGLESSNAYSTLSLDAPDSSEDSALSMIDVIGGDDEALEHVENRETIKPLLEALDPREKHILTLRFFRGMTQSQIAAEIGISQMHVSRLLARTLERLRDSLDQPARSPRARGRAGDAGWKIASRVSTASPAIPTAATVVSPPRKFQASPSRISWRDHDRCPRPGLQLVQLVGAVAEPDTVDGEEHRRGDPHRGSGGIEGLELGDPEQHQHQCLQADQGRRDHQRRGDVLVVRPREGRLGGPAHGTRWYGVAPSQNVSRWAFRPCASRSGTVTVDGCDQRDDHEGLIGPLLLATLIVGCSAPPVK